MNLSPDLWLASGEASKPWRNSQNILREKDLEIFPSWIAKMKIISNMQAI